MPKKFDQIYKKRNQIWSKVIISEQKFELKVLKWLQWFTVSLCQVYNDFEAFLQSAFTQIDKTEKKARSTVENSGFTRNTSFEWYFTFWFISGRENWKNSFWIIWQILVNKISEPRFLDNSEMQ